MANITFTSPEMRRDKTVYAVAGNIKTILGLAEEHHIPIPFECRDGNCGSCVIEVIYLDDKGKMAIALTEKEKARLREIGKLSEAEIAEAEVNDMPPRYRLACQYIARHEDIVIRFTGEPGGA